MQQLSLEVRVAGSTAIVAVSGEVDMATAPQLEACLRMHADRDVTLDLSEVGFLDSSGVSALVCGRAVLADSGHVLRITGEQDNVRTVLEITGLADALRDENN